LSILFNDRRDDMGRGFCCDQFFEAVDTAAYEREALEHATDELPRSAPAGGVAAKSWIASGVRRIEKPVVVVHNDRNAGLGGIAAVDRKCIRVLLGKRTAALLRGRGP
jgi:hypothetical protein